MIEREHRAVFTEQLQRRRRGRPRTVPTVTMPLRLPEPIYDDVCRAAIRQGRTVQDVMRDACRIYGHHHGGISVDRK